MTMSPETRALIEENKRLQSQIDFLKGEKRKLGMNFDRHPEKGEAQLLAQGKFPYLTFQPEYSTIKPDRTNRDIPHLLIEGDNISTLTALQATHQGKVDAIYIDPPYNTGNKDFVYNDSFVSSDDSFRHSKWLAFMESRLTLAKELLKNTGVIIVAIGDDEHHRLRMLMDQVFGEQNFISNVVWQGGRKNDSRYVSNGADYMLIYARNEPALGDSGVVWREDKPGVQEALSAGEECWVKSGFNSDKSTSLFKKWWRSASAPVDAATGLKMYDLIDEYGRVYQAGDLAAPDKPDTRSHRPLRHPVTGLDSPVPSMGWRYSNATMDQMLQKGHIHFGKDHTTTPRAKRYLAETTSQVAMSVFDRQRSNSGNHLKNIIGNKKFPFPKDHTVLMRWLRMVAPKDAVILDFFAGSGTTAEAVIRLNEEDGGTRQCILATSNFEEDGSPNGIARDITAERVKRVLTGQNWADGKQRDSLPGELYYYRVEFAENVEEQSAVGLLNVAENAFVQVQQQVSKNAEVFRRVDGALVSIWTSLARLGEYDLDNPVEDEVEAVNDWLASQDSSAVWYVPSESGESVELDDLFAEGASVKAVKPYTQAYESVVKNTVGSLLKREMIVPMEETATSAE